jgi:hypothetical protein
MPELQLPPEPIVSKAFIMTEPLKIITLSDSQIRSAIRSVYVRPAGKNWRVKRVAAPTIWRFGKREDAIAKAQALASPLAWDVVVLDRKGRVAHVLECKRWKTAGNVRK